MGADEQDAFSRYARRFYFWKRGQIRKLKRRSAKRERRGAVGREWCCICACGHQHRKSGLPLPPGQMREECVMCKWCICTASEHTTMPD